ncbi:MAG: hypothetical protein NTX03_02390 [Bacteroidetes bacterium]|nr:hypothetical protein [Bacteroidota bacterium]
MNWAKNYWVIIGIYVAAFVVAMLLLNSFYLPDLLIPRHFINFDAWHYAIIKNAKYQGGDIAFFPLFPMLWKLSGLGVYGISALNALLFLLAFYFLVKELGATPMQTVFYLSIPSFLFMYVPYSEAVFFVPATMLLIGLKKKNLLLILIGLFFCTLARPAITVLLPALFIAEFLTEKSIKKLVLRYVYYLLTASLGLLLVGVIQHHYTGEWFQFFSIQTAWNNHLQLPHFPLTSWGGWLIVKMDGSALLIGLIAGVVLILSGIKFLNKQSLNIPKEVLFSLGYLAGISLLVLFFRGGFLYSLNRFFYTTPFVIVVADYLFKLKINFSAKQILLSGLGVFLFWLVMGSYSHIQVLLWYLLFSVFLSLLFVAKSENKAISQFAFSVLILVNFGFQIYVFTLFLTGNWVA